MRIFFCVFLHAHVFLCFFGMRIARMHTKKNTKNMRILEKHTKNMRIRMRIMRITRKVLCVFLRCAYFFAVFFNAQNFVFFS